MAKTIYVVWRAWELVDLEKNELADSDIWRPLVAFSNPKLASDFIEARTMKSKRDYRHMADGSTLCWGGSDQRKDVPSIYSYEIRPLDYYTK